MPVKVVHLITLLEFGGAQGNTIHTVRTLDPQKYDAHLWTGPGAFWDKEATDSLAPSRRIWFFKHLVRPLHPLYDVWVLFDLWRALRRFQPKILHTHSSKAGIVGRIAARWAGVPIVLHTFHGFGFNERQNSLIRGLYIWLEKLTAPMATRLIFVSRSNMETATQLGIGQVSQYRLIRSGVPLQKLKETAQRVDRSAIKKELGIPEEGKIVLTVGAFKPQKNLTDFIRAAALVHARRPDTYFVILGDGELRPSLEKLIGELRLKDWIRMPGWRKDAAQIMAASDVFAMTSLWEGLPRALVEAMAIGLPSACYDTDGVRDILTKGSGVIIKQDDVAGMAAQLEEFLAGGKSMEALASLAKEKVGVEFDIDQMVKQQETLYDELLSHL